VDVGAQDLHLARQAVQLHQRKSDALRRATARERQLQLHL
jgi:hypothetical protein